MRFAYADPPYMGMGKKYVHQKEVNHPLLIDWLCRDFDAWALSCSTVSLQRILPMCPADVRICAWVKPFCSFKPGVPLAYAWEPVLMWRSQRVNAKFRDTVRDWVSCNITLKKGLCGAKPEGFSYWLFDALGMMPEDEFTDVFPGSGAVMSAYEAWKRSKAGLFTEVA